VTTQPDSGEAITVVKIGGSTLGSGDTSLRDIASARKSGRAIVVVHGGGALISAWLDRAGLEGRFVRGLRVTDEVTLEIVVAVLAGLVNKQLVSQLSALGAPAIGLSGADSMIVQAQRYDPELGFVGKIARVNPYPLEELLQLGYVPVIAPIASDVDGGGLLNTNADTAAGEIAAALKAVRLVFLTDVPGVLGADRSTMPRMDAQQARDMISEGVASGGMIPKLEAAVRAASARCVTRIVDGRVDGALARALAGEGGGTIVVA
jgi:acetylglutamate kinase